MEALPFHSRVSMCMHGPMHTSVVACGPIPVL